MRFSIFILLSWSKVRLAFQSIWISLLASLLSLTKSYGRILSLGLISAAIISPKVCCGKAPRQFHLPLNFHSRDLSATCTSGVDRTFITISNLGNVKEIKTNFKVYFTAHSRLTDSDLPLEVFQDVSIPANGSIQIPLKIDPSFSGKMFLAFQNIGGDKDSKSLLQILQFEIKIGQVIDISVYDATAFAFTILLVFVFPLLLIFSGLFLLLWKYMKIRQPVAKESADKAAIQEMISKGRLETALEKLYYNALAKDAELKREVLLLQTQFFENCNSTNLGLRTQQDYLLCQNRLAFAAICVLDRLMPDG